MEKVSGWCLIYDNEDVPTIYPDTLERTYVEGVFKDVDNVTFHIGVDFFLTETSALTALKEELKKARAGHRYTLQQINLKIEQLISRVDHLQSAVVPDRSPYEEEGV